MCTLIQKEVLIELVANAQAIIAMRVETDAPLTEEELRLGEIRNFLYSTHPDDISYSSIVNEVKEIRSKFEDKPILPEYR